ncbi:extensin-like [Cornus florida]|uniref:extensin-like n=1 Tax=Cornus florida TaxID=4283 RepID=UPI00289B62F7|nr:extensin-like [Cornus florida]
MHQNHILDHGDDLPCNTLQQPPLYQGSSTIHHHHNCHVTTTTIGTDTNLNSNSNHLISGMSQPHLLPTPHASPPFLATCPMITSDSQPSQPILTKSNFKTTKPSNQSANSEKLIKESSRVPSTSPLHNGPTMNPSPMPSHQPSPKTNSTQPLTLALNAPTEFSPSTYTPQPPDPQPNPPS